MASASWRVLRLTRGKNTAIFPRKLQVLLSRVAFHEDHVRLEKAVFSPSSWKPSRGLGFGPQPWICQPEKQMAFTTDRPLFTGRELSGAT